MKIIYTLPILVLYGLGANLNAQVGIGTKTPNATLHVVGENEQILNIKDNEGNITNTLSNDGRFTIGKATQNGRNGDGNLSIISENNDGKDIVPTLKVEYDGKTQNFAIYQNASKAAFNPASQGYWQWITDEDGDKSKYETFITSDSYDLGAYYGTETIVANTDKDGSGIFIWENGAVHTNLYRADRARRKTFKAGDFATGGSITINDENKGYQAGEACENPGTITFNSADDDFLGCAEIFNEIGEVTKKIWKKLNNK
ncbi:hypothetical protein [Ornithobacterium rhinotracheale]|uniref:hypothetical protein n=1 Tax=Ornithobacterium rhinotracheale TaxID=28251 RepID=UPI004036B3E0